MTLTIDVQQYLCLPSHERGLLDAWLACEGLSDKRIVRMALGEGYVDCVCCTCGPDGCQWHADNPLNPNPVRRFPVLTVPPLSAFEARRRANVQTQGKPSIHHLLRGA